jgi:Flp pilus assembly protein CpaB
VENIMSSKLFTTRQGTILLGVIAALIALVALIVYLHNYRSSVNSSNRTLHVLVAKQLIQKGTLGNVVGQTGLYTTAALAKSQVKTGAYVDPSTLAGKVALTDIYPNQQITAADFGIAPASVLTTVGYNQRAVTIPLGSPQSVGGQITAGSHVDVWVSFGGVNHLLYQDMYIIGLSGSNVTFRANPVQVGVLISASQNGSIWLALRPTVGSVVKGAPLVKTGSLTK